MSLFPILYLLRTTPNRNWSSLTLLTAIFKSCKPNRLGSVTKATISVFSIASITGHELPGGQSSINNTLFENLLLNH